MGACGGATEKVVTARDPPFLTSSRLRSRAHIPPHFSLWLTRRAGCRDIDLKTPSRPPAFCFVTFEQMRDAEEACRGRGPLSLSLALSLSLSLPLSRSLTHTHTHPVPGSRASYCVLPSLSLMHQSSAETGVLG